MCVRGYVVQCLWGIWSEIKLISAHGNGINEANIKSILEIAENMKMFQISDLRKLKKISFIREILFHENILGNVQFFDSQSV